MSEETPLAAQTGRSWRDIRQEVTSHAMSRQGRRRRQLAWLKVSVVAVLLGGMAWGAYAVIDGWRNDRAALAAAVKSEPVRDVAVITDGTLSREWVDKTLALPKGAMLLALDLPALRNKLEAFGQVRRAVVSRSFPDQLVVTLQERTPVARLQVQDGIEPKVMFVAKDGVVYEGFNYDKQMVATLPWLDGFTLTRSGSGFAPIAGMDAVANLLTTAQLQAPHLYRNWTIVSLARLPERDEIVVKGQDVQEMIFTRREDFFHQLAQLDYVMDAAQQQAAGTQILSVNLALGDQVPVRLSQTPEQLAKRPPPSQLNLTLPSIQRKGQRDL